MQKISAHLKNARKIKLWMEENGGNRKPSQCSKDKEERSLGCLLSVVRGKVVKPYLECKTEAEKEKYLMENPEAQEIIEIINEIDQNTVPKHLRNAIAYKEWVEKNGGKKKPFLYSIDSEERRLAISLNNIKVYIIKPYLNLKTEEERKAFCEKCPEAEEVVKILRPFIRINEQIFLKMQ